MLDVFTSWFGQTLTPAAFLVDIAFFVIGWLVARSARRKWLLLVGAVLLMGCSIAMGQLHETLFAVLAVVLCGVSTTFFVGAVAAVLSNFLRKLS